MLLRKTESYVGGESINRGLEQGGFLNSLRKSNQNNFL